MLFFFNVECNIFFYPAQVSQHYQAIPMLVIDKEQYVVSYGYFPASVFHFYDAVSEIQIWIEGGNWNILSHACPSSA